MSDTIEAVETIQIESAVVRFCGDSGDGMQLTGNQFTDTSAISGNDISTFPDFPAEIRAPAGTVGGVSGFQVNFSSKSVETAGDQPDSLVAMNPAALKANLEDLKIGGALVINSDAFNKIDFRKAKYDAHPFELDPSILERYDVHEVPMTTLTMNALADFDMKPAHKKRCKNFFALGLMYWVYDRSLDFTKKWIENKFAGKQILIDANLKALKSGYNYGETAEIFNSRYAIQQKEMEPGIYRQITGNSALAFGLTTAAQKAGLEMLYATYPITPATDILHELAKLKNFGVKTVQCEDEIASIGVALGASYVGSLGVTASSGPGICLKGEFLGLAVITELPLVIVNVQRGGPSTGLPTKTEQSDLLLSLYGRNGESPMPIVAASSPVDCFDAAIEASRIALEYMTPVMLLSDGYIANSSDLWKIPNAEDIPEIKTEFRPAGEETFKPYKRDTEKLSREWAIPGTIGQQHLLTGLEKDEDGNICYDAKNHSKMCHLRAAKVKGIANSYPATEILGKKKGKTLVIGWGGTYGNIHTCVTQLQKETDDISYIHLRHIWPLPNDLGGIIDGFENIVVPEINLGQLVKVIRDEYAVDAKSITKIEGKPFKISELTEQLKNFL
ncbi:MAG: 2-oxoacid:acceptor oxidoreductase subunit alpha [Lentisphaeraceae bacterium]|nr:2-oxoacid:acceptor oxidoreductase subunit alpha [Lentisphaeraceae bacterium]